MQAQRIHNVFNSKQKNLRFSEGLRMSTERSRSAKQQKTLRFSEGLSSDDLKMVLNYALFTFTAFNPFLPS